MNLLITGGLGYIGSHLCVELLKTNVKIFVIDDLSNSTLKRKKNIEKISGKKITFINSSLNDFKSIFNCL